MSALGTLFSEIANAIREKNGETGTMKPAEFPDKISALTVGSTDSGDTALKISSGEFTPAGSGADTIYHNLGVVPDVVFIFPGEGGITEDADGDLLLASMGLSQRVMDATGQTCVVYVPSGSKFALAAPLEENTSNHVSLGLPRGATTELFYVGGGSYDYSPDVKYRWVAFGNLL